jgi:hypothetical protein
VNAGRCELLDVPRLSAQLTSLERRVARSGKDSIDHPPGAFDDVANAAAGALVLATAGTSLGVDPRAAVKDDLEPLDLGLPDDADPADLPRRRPAARASEPTDRLRLGRRILGET